MWLVWRIVDVVLYRVGTELKNRLNKLYAIKLFRNDHVTSCDCRQVRLEPSFSLSGNYKSTERVKLVLSISRCIYFLFMQLPLYFRWTSGPISSPNKTFWTTFLVYGGFCCIFSPVGSVFVFLLFLYKLFFPYNKDEKRFNSKIVIFSPKIENFADRLNSANTWQEMNLN